MADGTIDQEEVWDDTALVESWNEAFAEYKVQSNLLSQNSMVYLLTKVQKYHSIAAKGGKVSPPPKATKKSFTNGDGATDKAPQLRVEVGDADDDEYDPSVGQASKSSQPSVGVDMPAVSTVAGAGGVALPQMLAAGGAFATLPPFDV